MRRFVHWIVFLVLLSASFATNLLPMERPVSSWRKDHDYCVSGMSEGRGFPFCYETYEYWDDDDDWKPIIAEEIVWKNFGYCAGFCVAMLLLTSYWTRRRFACTLGTAVVAQLALAAVLMLNFSGSPVLTVGERSEVLCHGYGWPYAVYYDDLPVVFDTLRRCLDDSEWWIQWGAAPIVLDAAVALLIVAAAATCYDLLSSFMRLNSLRSHTRPGAPAPSLTD
ncbi:MAG TPA: hypothetical protein VEJ63_04570 [Planctomycetota bacterium]|nr:hypothetical protein [Planctomycetota bacterium]